MSHCAPFFAGDCKALRKEPQRCDESHPQMEPAWVKVQGGNFSLLQKIYELPNGVKKKQPYFQLTKTECLYIATKFKAHSPVSITRHVPDTCLWR